MKTIPQHIEHIKGKPHHVRKRIAFGVATCGAALIALVWLAGSLGTGAFAIRGATFAESTGAESTVTVAAENGSRPAISGIAGVAAALQDAGAPAHIEIIDTASSTRTTKQAERTTIPF